jgi:PIN domain nuclease of toxin-antitoxin system
MSRYLLDTHVIYRWMRDDRRLGRDIRKLIANSDCAVSAVSIWEMLIKNARGKLPLPEGPVGDAMEAHGFRVLAITVRHIEATRRFGRSLMDPFDCLLVATAAEEGMLLVTQDEAVLELATRSKLPVARVPA